MSRDTSACSLLTLGLSAAPWARGGSPSGCRWLLAVVVAGVRSLCSGLRVLRCRVEAVGGEGCSRAPLVSMTLEVQLWLCAAQWMKRLVFLQPLFINTSKSSPP